MREVAEDIEEMFEPLQITEGYRGRAPIIPHKAFGKIRFRPGSEKRTGRRFELGQDAHLCIDKASPDVGENRAYLKDHTLLARSFATFVPTSSVFLVDLAAFHGHQCEMETWRSVTVYDVLNLIHKRYVPPFVLFSSYASLPNS